MPLFYQHTINENTKAGIWHIAENENFFLQKVPLQQNITHWHKRLQHLAGRYLLQELYPDFPYHLIEIADTKKPFLINEEYHFSISHCVDYAAVIISKDSRVGIDIEMVTPKIERIKHKFLNDDEIDQIDNWQLLIGEGHSMMQPATMLTMLWSCKEAVFKWHGNGGIDFKKHIHLTITDLNLNAGKMNCEFVKDKNISLTITYIFLNGICLAWVI